VPIGFLIVLVVWGTTPFSIKAGLRAGWQPFWFCAIRLLLATAVISPLLLSPLSGQPLGRRGRSAVLPLGVFGIALNFGITVWGQQYIGAGLASLIVGTQPITTTLVARRAMREPITPQFAASLGAGLLGLVVIFGADGIVGGKQLLGALAVLCGVTLYGAIFVYINKNLAGVNLVRVVATENLIGGTLVAVTAFLLEGAPSLPHREGAYVALIYLVLASSIVALLLSVWLVVAMGASRFSLMSFLTPLVGVAASVVWLNESVRPGMAVGGTLVAVALTLALRSRCAPGMLAVETRR